MSLPPPPGSGPPDLHATSRNCTTPRGTHAQLPRHSQPGQPSASATGMAYNAMRCTTQISGTMEEAVVSDAACNVTT